ncbi:MAG: glyoxalase/bleomycin resistance/extradiol dioxygenase family protein [Pseudomonadota bacterium]|nr:MAG: glyoxalase/bleomycin resistance/extradiol dioxygenase family protein [Pseudomonadota bacterium]
MATKMFVNLPVKDLERSVTFFRKLGYEFDQRFTDENATCMIIGPDNYVMLLVEKYFQTFTPKKVSDATGSTEVLVALSHESRESVDEIVQTAIAAGGRKYAEPKDLGFMYQWGFEDPDGHIWEHFWMDPNAVPPQ